MSKQQQQQQQQQRSQQQGEPSTDSSMTSSVTSSYMSYVPTTTSSTSKDKMILSTSSSIDKMSDVRKLEQIVQNFYTKTTYIILQSRVIPQTGGESGLSSVVEKGKVDKWFNLTVTEDTDVKEKLKFWKSYLRYHRSGGSGSGEEQQQQQQQQQQQPPPLVIDICLKKKNKTKIVLESWTLSLTHPQLHTADDQSADSLPALYKKSIVFFRALHSLVKVLPCYNLYRRVQQQREDVDFVLDYRLSTQPLSNRQDEISLGRELNGKDVIRSYEFEDISTPLGLFKVKLLFRESHHNLLLLDPYDNAIEKRLFVGYFDIEENFFGPSNTILTTEENTQRFSSGEVISMAGRSYSYRNSQTLGPSSSTTTTTSLPEKRMSVPVVRPFKSPSVSSSSSSQQQADLLSDTTNAVHRQRSGSLGKRTSFSSSFDKFFKPSSHQQQQQLQLQQQQQQQQQQQLTITHAPDDSSSMTKRWSRMSDTPLQEDEQSLEAFMKLMGAQKELKLFKLHYDSASSSPAAHLKEANNVTVTVQKVANGGIKKQLSYREREKTTKSLSYFRNRQEAHTLLTDSMSSIRRQFRQSSAAAAAAAVAVAVVDHPIITESTMNASNMSLDLSTSSSTKSSVNLPLKRAPRHSTESSRHAAIRYSPLKYRQLPTTTAAASSISQMPMQSSHHSNEANEEEDDSLMFKMSEELYSDDNHEATRQEERQQRQQYLSLMPGRYYYSSNDAPLGFE